jgi:hypothetical protein
LINENTCPDVGRHRRLSYGGTPLVPAAECEFEDRVTLLVDIVDTVVVPLTRA